MWKRKWVIVAGLVALTAIAMGLVAAAPADAGPPDPGPLPPGLAVKVFVHYDNGHRPGVDKASAAMCYDPGAAICDDYAIGTTSGGLHIKWADPTGGGAGIPYYVNLNYSTKKSPSLTGTAAVVDIDASFSVWEAASDAGLNYTNKGLTSNRVGVLDGKNVVGWKGMNPGILAVTTTWYYTNTGKIAETDMAFNNNYSWTYTVPVCNSDGIPACNPATYEDPANSGVANTVDLRNIATHEAGHTLMLLDLYASNDQNLTMYGYGAYAQLKKDTLALGDDLGVNAIYP